MLMQYANWPKPALHTPTRAPFCSIGFIPRRDTITRELFIEVWRIFTSGIPKSHNSMASISCSVVAWLLSSLIRVRAGSEAVGWTISTSSPASLKKPFSWAT